MFLKREDCEHFALILMQLVPQFTQAHLVAKEGTIGVVLEYAQDEQREVALITPNKALEFFREYEEFLPHYYK